MRNASEPETRKPAEPGMLPAASVPAWQPIVLGAAAGALGWGIRGQYGHETGAMIAGLLVSLTWMFLLLRRAPASDAIRAVAWATVAIGFGGAMTYGQTVGLTHDQALVGNWAALRWGMLGLAIKGGIWIGFSGLFLGMALGGKRYRTLEIAGIFAAMLALFFLGTWLLNAPFDPAHHLLPSLYFSDDWRWEPGAELKPRREVWGGLLLALLGAVTYAGFARKDVVARRLAGWAALGGALGFPTGQSVQAFHAWNRDLFRNGTLASLDPLINWWNFMETTFGAVFGAVLGYGLWRNRGLFAFPGRQHPSLEQIVHPPPQPNSLPAAGLRHPAPQVFEWGLVLLGFHTALLVISEFTSFPILEAYTDLPLVMGALPIMAAAHGRLSPWLIALPITLIPIAGKTVAQLVYKEATLSPALGWLVYGIVPVVLAGGVAIRLAKSSQTDVPADRPLGLSLAVATGLYFGLNYAFFRFPWPWSTWTSRTPNGLIFTACAAALLALALARNRSTPPGSSLPLTASDPAGANGSGTAP